MVYFNQLKSKYWQVQIRRYGVKPETRTYPTKDEAKIWARLVESEIDRDICFIRYEAKMLYYKKRYF
jgi:hypothetical protein